MAIGKCPACEKPVTAVNGNRVTVFSGGSTNWQGLTYQCPNCGVVLGCQIDPIAIRSDIVNLVCDALGKKRPF